MWKASPHSLRVWNLASFGCIVSVLVIFDECCCQAFARALCQEHKSAEKDDNLLGNEFIYSQFFSFSLLTRQKILETWSLKPEISAKHCSNDGSTNDKNNRNKGRHHRWHWKHEPNSGVGPNKCLKLFLLSDDVDELHVKVGLLFEQKRLETLPKCFRAEAIFPTKPNRVFRQTHVVFEWFQTIYLHIPWTSGSRYRL